MAAPEEQMVGTGIDNLIRLVNSRQRVELNEASALMGVSARVVEQWARLLEDEGIVTLEYQLTKVFLVWRGSTTEELVDKTQKIKGERETLFQDIQSLIVRASAKEGELEAVRSELEKISASLDERLPANLRKRLDDLRAIERDKQKALEERMGVIEKARENLEALERELKDRRELMEEIKRRAYEIENAPELEGKVKEIKSARALVDETVEEIAKLRASSREVVNEAEAELKRIEQSIGTLGKIDSVVKQIEDARKAAQGAVEELDEKLREMDKRLAAYREIAASSQTPMHIERLEKESARLRELRDRLEEQDHALQERADRANTILEEHERRYSELQGAKNRLATALDKYTQQLDEVDASYRNEMRSMRATMDEIERALSVARLELEKQLEAAKIGIVRYEGALKKREEIKQLIDAVADMSSERKRIVQQLNLLAKEVRLMNTEIEVRTGGRRMAEIKGQVALAKQQEVGMDSKREELRKMIKKMMEEK